MKGQIANGVSAVERGDFVALSRNDAPDCNPLIAKYAKTLRPDIFASNLAALRRLAHRTRVDQQAFTDPDHPLCRLRQRGNTGPIVLPTIVDSVNDAIARDDLDRVYVRLPSRFEAGFKGYPNIAVPIRRDHDAEIMAFAVLRRGRDEYGDAILKIPTVLTVEMLAKNLKIFAQIRRFWEVSNADYPTAA